MNKADSSAKEKDVILSSERKQIQEAKRGKLKELNLSSSTKFLQLAKIPEEVFELKQITTLNLNGNQIDKIPESIGYLTNLTHLYLKYNKLENLPESIGNLSNLTNINLNANPLTVPPIEVANKGIKAIQEYFRQLREEGKNYLYEAKLLIIGEAGAGKTSLAKKIQDPKYQLQESEQSTEGIDDVIIPYHNLEIISNPNKKMKTIKIFLASSSELKDDRQQFEIFINRKNKEYIKDSVFL